MSIKGIIFLFLNSLNEKELNLLDKPPPNFDRIKGKWAKLGMDEPRHLNNLI